MYIQYCRLQNCKTVVHVRYVSELPPNNCIERLNRYLPAFRKRIFASVFFRAVHFSAIFKGFALSCLFSAYWLIARKLQQRSTLSRPCSSAVNIRVQKWKSSYAYQFTVLVTVERKREREWIGQKVWVRNFGTLYLSREEVFHEIFYLHVFIRFVHI